MGGAIVVLFILPWLDRSPIRSIRYRANWYRIMLFVFAANFLMLGYLGIKPATELYTWMSRIGTLIYFGYFPLLFILSRNEKPRIPVPDRLTYKSTAPVEAGASS